MFVVSFPEAYPATDSFGRNVHDRKIWRILPDRLPRGILENGDHLGLLGQLLGLGLARLPVGLTVSGLAVAPAVFYALACRACLEGI